MISIPVAVHNEHFKWQLDLFWHAHQKIYGDKASELLRAVIIKRNSPSEELVHNMEWETSAPHMMCESFFDLGLMEYTNLGVPLNIQAGVAQIIADMPDDQVIEVTDCDMLHFRPSPFSGTVDHDVLIVSDIYESWHLFSRGRHLDVISPYFENKGRYYNGGFVPIVGTVRTLRKIMDEWIAVHVDILRRPMDSLLHWWAGMYALQAACEKKSVRMVARDYCYIPEANQLMNDHYIGHYSVDKAFDKRKYPVIDTSSFLKNAYYDVIHGWINSNAEARAHHS